MLGGALLVQKKYADAESLLRAGYEGMKQREKTIPPQGQVRLPEAIERLVQLYEAMDKKDDAAELTKSSNWNAGQWYDFACVYAVASGKIADKKQAYADRAMELLHKAVKAGYKKAAHMRKDTDLDPLRERPDFKKLVAGLENKGAMK